MNSVCCWFGLGKNHIIICHILCCCQVLVYLENNRMVWINWWRVVSVVEDNGLYAISFHFFVNILFNKLISSKLLCFCYMMFLDAWVIVLSIYEYFILFFIFLVLLVYALRFLRKKNSNLWLKLFIYLFIFHMLD